MKLVQRANKQLQISDELLEEYKKQGYTEVTVDVKASIFNKTSKKNEIFKTSEKVKNTGGGDE